MITLRAFLISLLCSLPGVLALHADPGKEAIGQVKVSLYHGSNSDLPSGGEALPVAVAKELQKAPTLKFTNYSLIGTDTQDVLRSYEMWARPSRTDDQFMVSFEPLGRRVKNDLRLDLELWWQKKKILKTDPLLRVGQPLYIRGPKWRKGHLIIAVELLGLQN